MRKLMGIAACSAVVVTGGCSLVLGIEDGVARKGTGGEAGSGGTKHSSSSSGTGGVTGSSSASSGSGTSSASSGPAASSSSSGTGGSMSPSLSANSGTFDFGTVTVGQSLPGGVITVKNVGNGATAALTTAITGSAFSITNDGCIGQTIAPESSCQVTVHLATATAGSPTGTLTVTDSASDQATVTLGANILTPGAISISPPSYDFMGWPVGTASPPQTLTLTNTGQTTTGALAVTLTPTNGTLAGAFTLTDPCSGTTLAKNATCDLTVTLTPGASGPQSASLVVNANPGGPASASLTGTGLASAALMLSPSNYAFATTPVGTTPAPTQTFTLTNNGGVPSSTIATSLSLGSGVAAGELAVTTDMCNGQTLPAAGTCDVTVAFSPTTFGVKTATLSVGGAPAAISGDGEDFQTLTVTTSGNGTGTVTGDSISCPGTCSEQVARIGSSPTVTLTAAPSAGSAFSGWTGACSGTGSCDVTMDKAQTVNAAFDIQVPITVTFRSVGGLAATLTSSPAGISCSGTSCNQTARFIKGTTVTLTVTGAGAGLVGWSNSCKGTTCAVQLNGAATVNATATGNNIVFASSTTADGSVGLAGADKLCNTAATSAGLPGTYVAFLLTSTAAPTKRLGSARGWIRPDGLPVADTAASIAAYVSYYPPLLDEYGQRNGRSLWVGLGTNGAPNQTCSDWTSNSMSLYGDTGESYLGANAWQYAQQAGTCNFPEAFYCFGTDLTSPVTVPAASGRRVFVSAKAIKIAGIPSADAECQAEAQAAGLPNATHFLALLSTTTAPASSRFNLTGPNWLRPDNVKLAATPTDFMNLALLAPISLLANGQPVPDGNAVAWSGGAPGVVSPAATDSCNDWSSTASNAMGDVAQPASLFQAEYMYPCNSAEPVICVEN